MGIIILGSRFKVQGSRFKVQGSRFKVQGKYCPFYLEPCTLLSKPFYRLLFTLKRIFGIKLG
jgi:hypothetical protein